MHGTRNDAHAAPLRARLLLLGPLLFLAVLFLPQPPGLGSAGHATLAVTTWMAAWWLTVAVALPVTALLPLALFPILGIADPETTAAPYANPIIFLFLGGFLLAAAIERWGLHRRLALGVIARTGTGPRRVVAGFMVVTAFISMWVSNTATAAMMLPIAVAVLKLAEERPGASEFGTALMLGIAYAASIGGVATLVGTPPNAIFAANAGELAGRPVGFAEWMLVGLPLSVVMLAIAWATLCLLKSRLPRGPLPRMAEALARQRAAMGPWSAGERGTAIVFALTALAWIWRQPKALGPVTVPGIQSLLPAVGDATIAMAAATVLFLTPVRTDSGRAPLLDWEHARQIPWGILLLFGGGLTLARQFEETGLTTWLAGHLAALEGLTPILLVAIVAILFIFLTELTSNTATAALAMPVMASVAAATGSPALSLMAAAALASSLAFMLPVGTPPNAIVFASGYIRSSEMARAGIWLNVASAAAVTVTMATLFGWVFE
jgi:sodium-dependent dicarboxylate transporter 2/3/5